MSETEKKSLKSRFASLGDPNLPVEVRMKAALRMVYDPELPLNIYAMGLVYDISFDRDSGKATVLMTLTAPNCPASEDIFADVRRMIRLIPEVRDVDVQLTWEPPWGPDMMSDAAKLELGLI